MGLFSRGKAERASQAAALDRLEVIQNSLQADIKAWVGRLEQEQEKSGDDTLSDEIMQIAGGMPYPDVSGLNPSQVQFLRGYINSYMSAGLAGRIATASNAAAAAESSGSEGAARLAAKTRFWRSVDQHSSALYGSG